MNIKSLYLPESSIQNDEFPAHITWNKKDELEVIVIVPEDISVKEIFNVVPDSVENIAENKIKITQFEINGYVGFVFESKILVDAKSIKEIKFHIRDLKSLEEKTFTKEIELFRPSIEVVKIPSRMDVKYNEDSKCFEFKDKIHIRNCGSGTALISVDLSSYEDFGITIPAEMDNFSKKVINDFEKEMEEITSQYPNYSQIINDFCSLIKGPFILNEENIKKIECVESELSNIFEDDESFLEDFSAAFWNSYVKNIQLVTKIESFMNYLNSIGDNKIILCNSIDIIESCNPTGNLELLIYVTDLNYNMYPTIEIHPISVSCDTQFKIPIYSLFDWNNDSPKGDK